MESVSELKPNQPEEGGPERERSTIEFPYTDLDSAVEVAKGVHSTGGNACDYDQLAAELKMEAKGGGFRLRVTSARTFGLITYDRGGRITLSELGRQVVDPQQERASRVAAFLAVPLYSRVFEQFKGSPLPPQAGLERAIESMGVGPKVKDKARQVLQRSAKQAGFFDAAPDRLVKPTIRTEGQPVGGGNGLAAEPHREESHPRHRHGGSGGGGQHPLIQGLLMTLPEPGGEWAAQERVNWLVMANSIFTMIYKGDAAPISIAVASKPGGSQSAT